MATKILDVKINQSIIAVLGRKLYQSEFFMVVLRELMQNSLDANSTVIDVLFHDNVLSVLDNGDGIQKIEGLLDTIGESIKADNIDAIGGYGLAKLAIFGCKEWLFQSISGSFFTGFNFDSDNKLESGTLVKCVFDSDDVAYNAKRKIEAYLSNINRDVRIVYNGEDIERRDYSQILINDHFELQSNSLMNGHVITRVNGLPTFETWLSGLDTTIYFDYQVTCSPYDTDYPLTSNRDGFLRSSVEYNDHFVRIEALRIYLQNKRQLDEAKEVELHKIVWRGKDYFACGDNITVRTFEESSKTISTYERYINQIADILKINVDNCHFGLMNGEELDARGGIFTNLFFIDTDITKKGEILSVALHEFTHYMGYDYHNEDFCSKLATVTSEVLNSVFYGDFRK